jgi:hypothetical protein
MPDIDTTEITKANRYHLAILKAEAVLKELNPPRPDTQRYLADILEDLREDMEMRISKREEAASCKHVKEWWGRIWRKWRGYGQGE